MAPLAVLLLALALGIGAPGVAAGAQAQGALEADSLQDEPPQGRMIEDIRIVGNERFEAETIRFFLAMRPGQTFDWVMARQDYMALLNTGWFRNVIMRWEEAGDGIALVIEVDELPLLRQIRIEGTESVSADDLLERLELIERPVTLNEAVNEERLREVEEVLTQMLQGEEGLQFVQVGLEIVESELGAGVDAVYRVIEGDQVRIAQVTFEGNTVFSDRELRWALERTGEHHFLSFLNKKDRYSPAGFEMDMFGLRQLYMEHGYLNFSWEEPEITVFQDDRELFWDEVQRLAVHIPIFEGPQFRVRTLDVEGNTQFTDAQLLSVLDMNEGDVMDAAQIQAAREAILAMYQDAGYLQVNAVPIPQLDTEEALADLTFRVAENDVYYVNRIEFAGNTHTRDHVLRRAMQLHEQQRWDQGDFDQSLRRLYRLGYFQNVEHELQTHPPGEAAEPGVPGDPDQGTVDVDIEVQEIGRNQISFGGGLSALEGGFVQFAYTTRNLFGYGQTLSLAGQFGSRRQNARVSFSDPYLFGKKLRFGADLFRDALDFPDFQREGTGGSVRLGVPLNRNESVAAFVEYNYEVIDIGEIGDAFGSLSSPLFRALFLTEGRRVTSSVRPFLIWNTINNPYFPSRGTRTSLSYEVAGGPLGGTLEFWRAGLNTTWYIPTVSEGSGALKRTKQLIAFNIEADWAEPMGDLEELPIFERFFLGGSNSVRGTRLRSIGPIDDRGNILGGTRALQYNIEYGFQLSDALRVSAFHDAGQAWLTEEDVNLGDMRRTAGVEFSVFAPVFNVPFRFFWAYNFDPLETFGEERSTFEFAIGSTF